MEMEHINENLIKVFINANDLEERGISFLDLVSGQEHIERFFYSILEEVDIDQHFRDSEAVTFQVMPKQNGIELYISRNDFGDVEGWSSELTKHLMESHDEDPQHEEMKQSTDNQAVEVHPDESTRSLIVKLSELDDVVGVSVAIHNIENIHGDLYYYQENYYLDIKFGTSLVLPHQIEAIKYAAFEYGEKSKLSQPILQEHASLIRESDAIKYFATELK
ncbi:adaptor protein MecA [Aerococcaceae bacterium DSM 111176]|nr:adaptor protein MecA [Aerococcaceae bacterium DSM 111176]